MGKGRTIAGLILENWHCKRKRHLWLTIGTDLRIDSRRDLDDIGASDIPLHPLNKLPYGQLDSEKVGQISCRDAMTNNTPWYGWTWMPRLLQLLMLGPHFW